MNSDDLTLVEVPAMLRNTFTTPDTPTARRNEALFIRLAREIGYSTIGRAINRDKSFVSRVLSGEVSLSLPELLGWMDACSLNFEMCDSRTEDDTQLLQILLRKAAAVLDERAKQEGDVMVFSAEEGKALLALAQRGIRAMQAEQEQR